jgi:hypothetical protein
VITCENVYGNWILDQSVSSLFDDQLMSLKKLENAIPLPVIPANSDEFLNDSLDLPFFLLTQSTDIKTTFASHVLNWFHEKSSFLFIYLFISLNRNILYFYAFLRFHSFSLYSSSKNRSSKSVERIVTACW